MGRLDALEDLPCEKVSREVYIYYLKALGASPVSFAMVLYVLYQVHNLKFGFSEKATKFEKSRRRFFKTNVVKLYYKIFTNKAKTARIVISEINFATRWRWSWSILVLDSTTRCFFSSKAYCWVALLEKIRWRLRTARWAWIPKISTRLKWFLKENHVFFHLCFVFIQVK